MAEHQAQDLRAQPNQPAHQEAFELVEGGEEVAQRGRLAAGDAAEDEEAARHHHRRQHDGGRDQAGHQGDADQAQRILGEDGPAARQGRQQIDAAHLPSFAAGKLAPRLGRVNGRGLDRRRWVC